MEAESSATLLKTHFETGILLENNTYMLHTVHYLILLTVHANEGAKANK